jgi:hypothetical protein
MAKRFFVPETLDKPAVMVELMNRLGAPLPAHAGEPVRDMVPSLRASGFSIGLAAVDELLDRNGIEPGDALRIKAGLAHHRLLKL